MDLTEFSLSILSQPFSKSREVIINIINLIFCCLYSHLIWTVFGEQVSIPNDLSIGIILNFVFSGQILIPILLFSVSIFLKYIIDMLAIPVLIRFFFYIIYWSIRKIITHFFYRKDERTLKMVLRFTTGIGFYKIVSNKLKRGRLFNYLLKQKRLRFF
jgi:hypothetical protein